MKESSLLWFIPFLIVLYQEIKHFLLYRTYKKTGLIKSARIVKIFQEHNARPLYKIKIVDGDYPYSKHQLKTTVLSALYPKLLKHDFKVFLIEESNSCVLANPGFIALNLFFVVLVGIGCACLAISASA